VLDAGRWLRPGDLATIIEQSRDVDELTAQLAGRLLQDIPLQTKTLLGFAALLGYCHPRFASLEPVLDSCSYFPWWTELTGDWRRFEPVWRGGVLAVCRSDPWPQVPSWAVWWVSWPRTELSAQPSNCAWTLATPAPPVI
jgi:hypothetical protein